MCVCGDYPQPDFYSEKVVTGRKDHRCCECGTEISKGEKHESVSGKWEGEMNTYRTCLPCVALRNRIADGGCFCFSGLGDELSYGDYDECDDVKAYRDRSERAYQAKRQLSGQ